MPGHNNLFPFCDEIPVAKGIRWSTFSRDFVILRAAPLFGLLCKSSDLLLFNVCVALLMANDNEAVYCIFVALLT